ncbi:MAG: hypothetical protein K6F05_09525 [Succinivibrio sp.]|nr:hypothetical protein [Succinivibrio sp.]
MSFDLPEMISSDIPAPSEVRTPVSQRDLSRIVFRMVKEWSEFKETAGQLEQALDFNDELAKEHGSDLSDYLLSHMELITTLLNTAVDQHYELRYLLGQLNAAKQNP